ncbi:MAG: hypothetical protein DRQ99_03475, partial [Candidatus Parabeggiatoa sp. nov. 3]
SIWWATKTRYPPYIDRYGGQQKHVTHPTLIDMVGYIDRYGGQQKHVTHPTLIDMVGNKNTLPTLHFKWWATKTRYPPYILITDN